MSHARLGWPRSNSSTMYSPRLRVPAIIMQRNITVIKEHIVWLGSADLEYISKCQTHLCAWHSLHDRSLRLQNLGRSYHREEQYLSVNHYYGEIHSPRIYQPEGASSFRGTRSVQTSSMATCYVHPGRLHWAGLWYPVPKIYMSTDLERYKAPTPNPIW